MFTKRFAGKILLWCMLLCVCLFGFACAESVTIEGENFTVTFPNGTEEVLFLSDTLNTNLQATAALKDPSFTPDWETAQWSYQILRGDGIDVSVSNDGNDAYFSIFGWTHSASEVQVQLDCTWCGETLSQVFTLRSVEEDETTPAEIDAPDLITVVVGEEFTIKPSVLPVDYDDYGMPSSWSAYLGGSYDTWPEYEFYVTDGVYQGVFNTPGYYTLGLQWNCSNMALGKHVTLAVCEEEGVLPPLNLQLDTGSEWTHTTHVGANISSGRYVNLSNYSILKSYLPGEPTWSMTYVSGPENCIYYEDNSLDPISSYKFMFDPSVFTQADTAVARIDCTWGELSASTLLKVEAIYLEDAPYGIDVPDTLTVTAGEPFALSRTALLPAGSSILNDYAAASISINHSEIYWTSWDDAYEYFLVTTPGVYECMLGYTIADFYFEQPLTLRVTDENGEIPQPKIELTCAESTHLTYYVGDWGTYPGDLNIHLSNYDYLSQLYEGEPQWTFEYTGNTDFMHDYCNTAAWYNLGYNTSPKTSGDGQVLLTVTWGDLTTTCTFNVSVLPTSEAPTGLNLPDSITVMAGEAVTFGGDSSFFLPESYVAPSNPISFLDIPNLDRNYWQYTENTNEKKVLKCFTPGVYPMTVWGFASNVRLEKTVFVYVTDENGNYPEPAPQLSFNDFEFTSYVGGNVNSSWHINIENYAGLKSYYSSDPTWTLTTLSGETDLFTLSYSDSPSYLFLDYSGRATVAGDTHVRLTCTWGEASTSIDVVCHAVGFEPSTPTDLDLPSEITVTTGETFSLPRRPATLPENVTIPDSISAYGYLEHISDEYFYETSANNETITYLAGLPGIYETTYCYWLGNYSLQKSVTIRIADENGVIPEPELQLSADSLDTLYLNGNTYPNLVHITLDNYYALPDYGDVVWDLSVEGASEDQLYTYWSDTFFNIHLDNQPETTGDITITVSCTYGELYEEYQFTVSIIDLGDAYPTELNLPESVTVAVGESTTLQQTDLLPKVFADSDDYEFYFTWNENAAISSMDGVSTITGNVPGVYPIQVSMYNANIYLTDTFLVNVADENGVVPPMQFELYTHNDRTEMDLYVNGNYLPSLETYSVLNFFLLGEYITGTPEWSVEVLGGDASMVNLTAYDQNQSAYIDLVQHPTAAGTVTLRVSCTWGGHTATKDMILNIHGADTAIPTELNIPDEIICQMGESVHIDLTQVTSDADLLPDSFSFQGISSMGYSTYSGGNYHDLIIYNTGICLGEYVWQKGNVELRKTVMFKMADSEGNVPEPGVDLYIEETEKYLSLGGSLEDEYLSYIYIENSTILSSLYGGAPSWSIETVSGTDGLITLFSNNTYAYMWAHDEYAAAGDTTVKVTVTWGELSTSFLFTLHVVDSGVTESGLVLPDELIVSPGEYFSLDARDMMPDTWVNGITWPLINVSESTGQAYIVASPSDLCPEFQAVNPGIYSMDINWEWLNISRNDSLLLKVTNEDGTLPALEMDMNHIDEAEADTLYLGGNSSFPLDYYSISNYDTLKALYGTEPEWSFTTDEQYADLFDVYGGNRYRYVDLNESPDVACDVTYTATCTWGDLSYTWTDTLHFVDAGERTPTGLDLPESIRVKVGETIDLPLDTEVQLLPANALCAEGEPYYDRDYSSGIQVNYTDDSYYLTSDTPGYHSVTYYWHLYNFYFVETVIVEVEDENGNVPAPAMDLYIYEEELTFYTGGNTTYLTGFDIGNSAILYDLYNCDPTLTVTCSDPSVSLSAELSEWSDKQYTYADINLTSGTPAAGEYECTITCTWGDVVSNGTFTLTVLENPNGSAPTGLNLPDQITLALDEVWTIDRTTLIQPEGWTLEDRTASPLYYSSDKDVEPFEWEYEDEEVTKLIAREPGTYNVTFELIIANFSVTKTVTVTILDENDEDPSALTFESRFTAVDGQRDIYLSGNNSTVHGFQIPHDVFQNMQAIYGGTPTWTLSNVEGELSLTTESYNNDQFVNLIKLNDITSIGATTGDLTCTWGDQSVTLPFSINVVADPEVIPETLNVPDTFTIKVGESFTLSLDTLLTEGVDPNVSDIGFGIGGNGELWESLSYVDGNDVEQIYQFSKPGVYVLNYHLDYVNFFITKDVVVSVADENGELPVPAIELSPMTEDLTRTIYTGGNTWGLYTFDMDWDLANTLQQLYGEWPTWSYEVLEGTLPIGMFSDQTWAEFYVDGDITEAQKVVIRVTCSCGDLSTSKDFTLNIVDLPIDPPTGLDFPDMVELQVGETFTVYDSCVLPTGWTLEGEEPYIYVNGGNEDAWQHLMWVSDTEDSSTYMFDAAGTYPVNIEWTISNISVYKSCIIRVADENGEYPLPQIMIDGYTEETFYRGSSNTAMNYGLMGIDILSSMFEGDPVWSYELLNETDVDFYTNVLSYESDNQWFEVHVKPDSPLGELSMKITLTWDTVSTSVVAACTVVESPNGIPTLAPVQTNYQITLGESLTLPYPTFLPEGWTDVEGSDTYFTCWTDQEGATVTYQEDSFLLEFAEPGVYSFIYGRATNNFDRSTTINVTVVDENGNCNVEEMEAYVSLTTNYAVAGKGVWVNLSANGGSRDYRNVTLTLFQDGKIIKKYAGLTLPSYGHFLDVDLAAGTYMMTLSMEDSLGNACTSDHYFVVADPAPLAINSAQLLSLYDANIPVCIVDYTGGSDVACLELLVYNKYNDQMPLRTENYASSTTSIHDLPRGTYRVLVRITSGDEVVEAYTNWYSVGVDAAIAIKPDYCFMTPGYSYQLQLTGDTDDIASVTWSMDNPDMGSISADGVLTSTDSGHAFVTALITLNDGSCLSLGLDVDSDYLSTLNLPAALTTIEDEAFMGTAANCMVIPYGAKSIGSLAFADSESLMLLDIPATVTTIAEDILSGSGNARIVCTEGSKAQEFAEANGIPYFLKK